MKLCTSVLLSALAAAALLADAWTISSTPVAAPSSSLGDHQELAKTWTVAGDSSLTTLELGAVGRVFVDYDASLAAGTVAKIVVTGNSSALLDVVDVASVDDNGSAIKLRLADKDLTDKGYLLTQVYVAKKQSISSMTLLGNGDVVVGSDVLVQSDTAASLTLAVAGSSDLFAGSDSTSFDLGALSIGVAGSGDVQFVAQDLELERSLGVGIAGSGDVAVVAKQIRVKDSVITGVAGSGDVYIQSDELTAFNLSTSIAGSGDVTYARAGAVERQVVDVTGSGDVAAGSIVAVDTNVSIVGSGDVVVQTSGKLQVSAHFSGTAKYYGVTPREIVTTKSWFGAKKKPIKQAKKNAFDVYDVHPLPARKPVFLAIQVKASNWFSSEPQLTRIVEISDDSALQYFSRQFFESADVQSIQSLAAVQSAERSRTHGVVVFAGVALALVSVGVAAAKYKTRKQREQYAPLV